MAYAAFRANADVGFRVDDIYRGLSRGKVRHAKQEIDAAIADIVERGLATVQDADDVDPMPDKLLKITPRGRDFVNRGCPWDRLEEFN